jgi:hypothetical protein
MRIDVDAPLNAEWMSGRIALATGGGGTPRMPYPGVTRAPTRAGARS